MSELRNKRVDGLKGIASVIIMLFHLFCRYNEIFLNVYPKFLFINVWGVFGFTLFLIISGYYLASSRISGFRFLKKRFLRLWPLYALAITVLYIISRFFPLPDKAVSFKDYLLNLIFVNGVLSTPYVDSAHWYLTTLVGCIIAFSAILSIKPDKRSYFIAAWMLLIVGLKIAYSLYEIRFFVFIKNFIGGNYAPLLCAGVALYYFKEKHHVTGIVLGLLSLLETYYMLNIKFIVVAIIDCSLLYLVLSSSVKFLNVLECRLFIWLGSVSYSLYIVHQFLAYKIIYYASKMCNGYNSCIVIVAMIVVFIYAVFLHYIFEKPISKWIGKGIQLNH